MYTTVFKPLRRHAAQTGAAALLLLLAASCNPTNIDPVTDPNNPSLESVLVNASLPQISALGVGAETSYRLGHANNGAANQVLGSLGREVILLASNEPRWYTEILGTKGSLDDAAFFSVASYNGFARVIRAAKVFNLSAQNTSVLTAAQKQGIAGFSHTYEALGKLHLLNLMGSNGIRIDVDNIQKPGPFVTPAAALTNIRQLLNQGAGELAAAGSAFAFPLSSGFAGFNTPATFLRFNRALATRVAVYQGDYTGAKDALAASFYDPTASLTLGPKVIFTPSAANDAANPYFQQLATSPAGTNPVGLAIAPRNFVTEAEAGDLRLAKAPAHAGPAVTRGGITAEYDARVFTANTSSLDIIRNEELILLAAEIKANNGDLSGAAADINVIRTRAGGLTPRLAASYSGLTSYVDEILKQRRYSLFYEGHRLVDLRRLRPASLTSGTVSAGQTLAYAMGAAPSTVGGSYKIFDRLEKPSAEKQWDIANP